MSQGGRGGEGAEEVKQLTACSGSQLANSPTMMASDLAACTSFCSVERARSRRAPAWPSVCFSCTPRARKIA